ncbi:hypothetical protein EVG20_g7788 [Dentipellis fragilis]|uniref:Holocytochrome c-type synthase n=1 Tax=Dentipellis fragilis TaxID=205917 RepID=A0A4Y9YC48_9AGAM|nr:hypothetical protein EVG20_g7788 [Dentipellis fragilis]
MGQSVSTPAAASSATCPVDHKSLAKPAQSSGGCPIDHKSLPSPSSPPPAQCPTHVADEALDPRTHLPPLSQTPAASQTVDLPTSREISTIPRDEGSRWEYPSPQQFHNALARKGWETPEEHVETMVQIHNFLNEMAWDEVRRWEAEVNPSEPLQLVRFKGRPGELSPKARFWLFAGWLLPSRFNTEPPFDRHDWIVRRPSTNEEVRYVIDYYSAPPLADGSPVFSLDVRPALDSPSNIAMRIRAATREAWGNDSNQNQPNHS